METRTITLTEDTISVIAEALEDHVEEIRSEINNWNAKHLDDALEIAIKAHQEFTMVIR